MRYLSHTQNDIETMLKSIGIKSVDELFENIPESLRVKGELNLPKELSEWELEEYITSLANKNFSGKNYIGAGSYNHHIPYTY